jgi:hypothetical protein
VDAERHHRWKLGRARPNLALANAFGLAIMTIGAGAVCAWLPVRVLWMLIVGIAFFVIGALIALITMVQVEPQPMTRSGAQPRRHTLKRPSRKKVEDAEAAIRAD